MNRILTAAALALALYAPDVAHAAEDDPYGDSTHAWAAHVPCGDPSSVSIWEENFLNKERPDLGAFDEQAGKDLYEAGQRFELQMRTARTPEAQADVIAAEKAAQNLYNQKMAAYVMAGQKQRCDREDTARANSADEARARAESDRPRIEAEVKAKIEADAAKIEADARAAIRARIDADLRAKEESEARAKAEAEAKAEIEAASKAKDAAAADAKAKKDARMEAEAVALNEENAREAREAKEASERADKLAAETKAADDARANAQITPILLTHTPTRCRVIAGIKLGIGRDRGNGNPACWSTSMRISVGAFIPAAPVQAIASRASRRSPAGSGPTHRQTLPLGGVCVNRTSMAQIKAKNEENARAVQATREASERADRIVEETAASEDARIAAEDRARQDDIARATRIEKTRAAQAERERINKDRATLETLDSENLITLCRNLTANMKMAIQNPGNTSNQFVQQSQLACDVMQHREPGRFGLRRNAQQCFPVSRCRCKSAKPLPLTLTEGATTMRSYMDGFPHPMQVPREDGGE